MATNEPTREQVERVAICANCGKHDVFFKCAACGSEFYNVAQSREASRERFAPEVRRLRKEVRALLDRVEELSASLRKCQDALVEKADRAETAERERDGARGAAETYRNDAQHREDAEAFNWGEAPRRLPPLPWEPAP
jgi:hypothetical protein